MRVVRSIPLLLAGLLAGCAEGPFIDLPISQTVEKPADPVVLRGVVAVCYSDSDPWAEVEELARESCAKYGYEATLTVKTRWACRMTAPHRASFACSAPGMVDPMGRAINPTDKIAVEAWSRRTGKTPPKPVRVVPGAPLAPQPAPVPAPTEAVPAPGGGETALPEPYTMPAPAPTRPLTPADIAGKPSMAPAPLVAPLPQAAPPTGGFTLEPGSWGQHFED